jgi:kynureninase
VHERHHQDPLIPRFEGWWGQNKATRFLMGPQFDPIPTVEAWQLSNPPIFQLAAMRASLEIFDRVGMAELRRQSMALVGRLEARVLKMGGKQRISIVTPSDPAQRGSHLSLRVPGRPNEWVKRLESQGVIADGREPDIVRVAPAPLYTRMEDVEALCDRLEELLSGAGT